MASRSGPADDKRAHMLGAWLLAQDEYSATPRAISEQFGWDAVKRANAIRNLRTKGFADGPQSLLTLTENGAAYFSATVPPAPDPPAPIRAQTRATVRERSNTPEVAEAIADFLEPFPINHQCFIALIVSAASARYVLGNKYTTGHYGFVAYGDTGTGKGASADVAGRILGVDFQDVTVHMPSQTNGTMKGRMRLGGFDIPAAFDYPMVLLDEADKASTAVRLAAFTTYFQGNTRQEINKRPCEIRATPILTANRHVPLNDLLGEEYMRRAIIFDTAGTDGFEIEDIMATLEDASFLRLETLRADVTALPDECRTHVFAPLRQLFTRDGVRSYSASFMEVLTLGYMMAFCEDDAMSAALEVARMFVALRETVPGFVLPGWEDDVQAIEDNIANGVPAITAAIRAAQDARRPAAPPPVLRKSAEELRVERMRIDNMRGQVVGELRATYDCLTPGRKIPALTRRTYGIQEVMSGLIAEVQRANSEQELNSIAQSYSLIRNEIESLLIDIRRMTEPEPDEDEGYEDYEEDYPRSLSAVMSFSGARPDPLILMMMSGAQAIAARRERRKTMPPGLTREEQKHYLRTDELPARYFHPYTGEYLNGAVAELPGA